MLLRGSGEHDGVEHDYTAVNGQHLDQSTVADADVLVSFAEACVGTDRFALSQARAAVAKRLGHEALVDAAAIVAIFCAVVRVADATGIPIEDYKVEGARALREELGIEAFKDS